MVTVKIHTICGMLVIQRKRRSHQGMKMTNEECKHGMNPEWCADCLGHKDLEEKERELGFQMVSNLLRHNKASDER
jgi:hypothetical protein